MTYGRGPEQLGAPQGDAYVNPSHAPAAERACAPQLSRRIRQLVVAHATPILVVAKDRCFAARG
jgi:hypothetical protein